ncbi:hypothetical protein CRE_06991 [Caenorhabditis remanei]|uniref:RING-type domain-containing protein n=1 Tax=Caenorhabditis remanei TaxID=31234 RepID=E3NB34_CAERE|nr:hypothetical protein CRE_06991 [Caenorhabditis remanei]
MQQQRVPDVDINVTPRVLNFPKNGRTSLVLKATVSGRDEAYPWSFSLESQLPECFTIVENPIPMDGHFVVTYNGLLGTNLKTLPDITVVAELGNFRKYQGVKIQVGDQDEFGQIRTNALQCLICVLQFTETGDRMPRILSGCGHTLCDCCIKEIGDGNRIACPFCRIITNNFYPPNFSLIQAIEEKNNQIAVSELSAPKCCDDPTVECSENRMHEATGHCRDCLKDYCLICFAATHPTRELNSHDFLPIKFKEIQIPKCRCSRDQASRVCVNPVCTDPEKFLCLRCFVFHHKACGDSEIAKDHLEKHYDQIEAFLKRLQWNQAHFTKKAEVIGDSLNRLKVDSKAHLKTVKYWKDKQEVKKHVQKEKERLTAKKEQALSRSECVRPLIRKLEKCVARKTDLHRVQEMIQEAQIAKSCKIEDLDKYRASHRFDNILKRRLPPVITIDDGDDNDDVVIIPVKDLAPGPSRAPSRAPRYAPRGELSTRQLRSAMKREQD